jgi:hypothetical protein
MVFRNANRQQAAEVALSSPLAEAAGVAENLASLGGGCDYSAPSAGKRLKWPVSAIKNRSSWARAEKTCRNFTTQEVLI